MLNTPSYVKKSKGERHGHLIFKSAKNKMGDAIETNWHELTYRLQSACHKIATNKLDVELFSPWTPKVNSYGRTKDCVESTALLAFDLDKIDTVDVEQVSEWCAPYANFVHTTHSHGIDGKGCFRVYIPLENSIPIEQYQSAHTGTLETLPEIKSRIDLSSADVARCFFMPSCPPETEQLAKFSISFSEIYAPTTSLQTSSPIKPCNSPTATQGNRNSGMASYAGKAYAQGLTPQEFMQDAMNWGLACNPPMDEKEIESVVVSMWNTHKRNNQGALPTTIDQTAPRFQLLGINDLAALPPTKHLVKGILPSSGLAAIYGPSGSGKTFLALDLIMAIACQSDWFGHKVKNVPVTYVGLEGKGGINNRIQAWCIKNPLLTPANFKIILDNFDLMKEANVAKLAQAIITAQNDQGVIVIDTLNQASPAADENSSQDMGVIIKHLKLLQELTDGLVLIIHHTGKNTTQGLRGHSSLKAALDVNIEVMAGDKRSWLLEKSKDGECGKSFGFRLATQSLGFDSDGDPITSCTVERDHSVLFAKPQPSGKLQQIALKVVKQALSNVADKRMNVEAAISAIANSLTTVASNKRNNSARRLLTELTGNGYLSSELINDEGWIWLP